MILNLLTRIKNKLIRKLAKSSFFRKITKKIRENRTNEITNLFLKYLPEKGKILDIGTGASDKTRFLTSCTDYCTFKSL